MKKITFRQIIYLLIASGLLFPLVRFTYNKAIENHYEYVTKGGRDVTEELSQGITILQEIPGKAGDLGLSFMFSTYGHDVSGEITIRGVSKKNGIVYFDQTIPGNKFRNNEFVDFFFPKGRLGEDDTVEISFTSTSEPTRSLRLLTTKDDEIQDYVLTVNGDEQPYDLFSRRILLPKNPFFRWSVFGFVLLFIPFFAYFLFFLKTIVSQYPANFSLLAIKKKLNDHMAEFSVWSEKNIVDISVRAIKKFVNRYLVLFSVLASACFMLSTRIVIGNEELGTNSENYVLDFNGSKSVLSGIIVFLMITIFSCFADRFLGTIIHYLCSSNVQMNIRKIRILYFFINVIFWIPYYLSYYPGGIYSDTFASVTYYDWKLLTNRHPLLYSFVIGRFIRLSELFHKDLTWAFGLFFLFQMTIGAFLLQSFLKMMLRNKIHPVVIHMIMTLFIFYPLIPLFLVSIWKDTPFALSFLWWFLAYADLLNDTAKNRLNLSLIIHFSLGAFLVAFTRNNGIYIVLISIISILFILSSRIFPRKKLFYYLSIFTIMAIILIQGPVYDMLGVEKTDTVEKYGIPLQQIAAVIVNDGRISEKDKELLSNFVSIDAINEKFAPCVVDPLKWSDGFNDDYLAAHQKEFIRLWVKLFLHNPRIYIKEYLLSTVGFWNIDNNSIGAYVQNYVWRNSAGVKQVDLFQKQFGFSFQHYVNPRYYISGALFFWLFAASAFFCMNHYGWKKLVYFVPPLSLWLTVMIATPVAWSLRYVEGLVFTVPFVLLIPAFLEQERIRSEAGEENALRKM